MKTTKLSGTSLWTKDFTIITLGSVVSLLGNAMAGFAISLFVLDYTDTPFLYALYVFLYTLPQITAPILAGPFMDRFSRRRTIYLLDFVSAALYLCMGLLIRYDVFNFALLAVVTVLIGTINSVYTVAFDSFYPMLITEGNYSKAYSVSSTLGTLSMVMIPVATFLYKQFGIFPILLANAVSFLIAALFEVRISDVEKQQAVQKQNYGARQYLSDTRDGFRYLISEKGLLLISVYFAFMSFASGASTVITLPWFKASQPNGEYMYMFVWSFMVIGRLIGGLLLYRFKMPSRMKYGFAFVVYLASALLEGTYLYSPTGMMCVACFCLGIFSATSYNIRVSATQSYVPNEMKGRFNGAFLMLSTVGSMLGELIAGAAAEVFPMRATLSGFMVISGLASIFLVGGGAKHIKAVYNRPN